MHKSVDTLVWPMIRRQEKANRLREELKTIRVEIFTEEKTAFDTQLAENNAEDDARPLKGEVLDEASRAVVQALDKVYHSASFYFKPRSDETQELCRSVHSILVSIDTSTGLIVQTTYNMISTDNTPCQHYDIGNYAIHPIYVFILLLPHNSNI